LFAFSLVGGEISVMILAFFSVLELLWGKNPAAFIAQFLSPFKTVALKL